MATYLFGMMGCLFLFQKKHYIEAITFICVLQMQLIEFFLWRLQHPTHCSLNKLFAYAGIIINHLEPVVLYVAILYFARDRLPPWTHWIVLIYIITATYYVLGSIKKQSCVVATPTSSPHLYWDWNRGKYYQIFYFLFLLTVLLLFFYGLKAPYNQFVAWNVLLFFLLSYVIYGKKFIVGSMWCFFSSFIPWILLFYIIYQKQQ
jgi:hypothetical protein